MIEFTPGPWKRAGGHISTERGTIAQVPSVRDEGVFDWLANARLIAAAPDLLEAAKALHDAFEYWENQDDPVLVDVRKALAKAEGRDEG